MILQAQLSLHSQLFALGNCGPIHWLMQYLGYLVSAILPEGYYFSVWDSNLSLVFPCTFVSESLKCFIRSCESFSLYFLFLLELTVLWKIYEMESENSDVVVITKCLQYKYVLGGGKDHHGKVRAVASSLESDIKNDVCVDSGPIKFFFKVDSKFIRIIILVLITAFTSCHVLLSLLPTTATLWALPPQGILKIEFYEFKNLSRMKTKTSLVRTFLPR